MPTFIGYNTIGAVKKVTLVDNQLIVRDLLNAFNIKQGQVPGRPDIGCPIWSYLFENVEMNQSVINDMKFIVQRTCSQDPRVQLRDVQVSPQDNGILFEVTIQISTDVEPTQLSVYFDGQAQQASLV
jgi:phage baseplate assembly protein W